MTPQETIETIKTAIAEVEWNYPMEYAIAFENVIESLEKQIPKKPIITALNVFCPECNHDLGKERAKREALSNFKYFGYCSACGCALDWSDSE